MSNQTFIFVLLGIFFTTSCRMIKNANGTIESGEVNRNKKIITKNETKLIDSSMTVSINTTMVVDTIVQTLNKINIDDSTSNVLTPQFVIEMEKDSIQLATENAEKLLKAEENRIKEEKEKALEWDIMQLNSNKAKSKERYIELHKYFERYTKVEATNRQLNIDYYTSKAIRLNKNQTGVQFIITSNFPQNISKKRIVADIEKLASTSVQALSRYESVSMIEYENINFEIEIKYYGNSVALEKSIKSEFDKLKAPYKFIKGESEETFLQIEVISSNIFEKDYQKWIKKEQQINRKIRMKQMQLQKLLKE
jgi:hypothetical protein